MNSHLTHGAVQCAKPLPAATSAALLSCCPDTNSSSSPHSESCASAITLLVDTWGRQRPLHCACAHPTLQHASRDRTTAQHSVTREQIRTSTFCLCSRNCGLQDNDTKAKLQIYGRPCVHYKTKLQTCYMLVTKVLVNKNVSVVGVSRDAMFKTINFINCPFINPLITRSVFETGYSFY